MRPITVLTNTFNGTEVILQSGWATFSVNIEGQFEVEVPIVITTPANVSAGAEAYMYNINGPVGAYAETEGHFLGAFPATGGATARKMFNLRTGNYYIAVQVGGGSASSWNASLETCRVITAYE